MTVHLVIDPTSNLDAAFAIRAQAYAIVREFGEIHLTCDMEREGDDCAYAEHPC